MRFFTLLAAVPAALAAPLQSRADADVIPGRWIAKLRSDASASALESTITSVTGLLGGTAPTHKYNFGAFKGFAFSGPESILSLVQALAQVESIEPDSKVYASALVTQQNPPYGLARISHREKGQNTYIYDESAGAGTYSYIIDTGIFTGHQDFEGRAIFGANFADDGSDADGNGHGTHVAGTTGSKTYGVAKKTTLIAVKVLGADGSGTNAGVLAGIDWAVNDAKSKGRIGKAVGNLSLGGLFSQTTNDAVAEAVAQGFFLAVAAGNSGLPTITSSPASAPEVCTVAASDANDGFASFSNFGALVDIIGPGVDVTSTWIRSSTDTNTISGTSMATPHITGLGAYLLGLEGAMTPDALCKRIQELSTKGAVDTTLKLLTQSYLAYNGNGA